jgi:hypothetical protein
MYPLPPTQFFGAIVSSTPDSPADRGRAEHDVLQGAPPLGHQREAAFAPAAQGSQQRVTGFRVDVQLTAAGL